MSPRVRPLRRSSSWGACLAVPRLAGLGLLGSAFGGGGAVIVFVSSDPRCAGELVSLRVRDSAPDRFRVERRDGKDRRPVRPTLAFEIENDRHPDHGAHPFGDLSGVCLKVDFSDLLLCIEGVRDPVLRPGRPDGVQAARESRIGVPDDVALASLHLDNAILRCMPHLCLCGRDRCRELGGDLGWPLTLRVFRFRLH